MTFGICLRLIAPHKFSLYQLELLKPHQLTIDHILTNDHISLLTPGVSGRIFQNIFPLHV